MEEVRMSLFANDLIIHIENPKDINKKKILLEFSEVAEDKINMQKSVAFLQ